MRKKIRVTMPDGSLWDVPADAVARNYAEYYSDEKSGDAFDAEYKDAMSSSEMLLDWAANNMNWSDVEGVAKLYRKPDQEVDYQEGWVNGDKTVIES